MSKETKEVAVKESTDLVTAPSMEDWGDDSEMSGADLVVPKILAQQGLSKYVTDGVAKFGDFCNSLTGEIFGDIKNPIKIIPFYMQKIWVISEKIAGKDRAEFRSIIPVTPDNEFWPWEYEEDGKKFSRSLVRNFYCLIEGKEDGMCYIVPFKGKSARAGKILATQMYTMNKLAGLTPAGTVIELSGSKESNDDGTFIVQSVKPLHRTRNEDLVRAFDWFKTVKAGKTQEDTSDYTEAPTYQDDSTPF